MFRAEPAVSRITKTAIQLINLDKIQPAVTHTINDRFRIGKY